MYVTHDEKGKIKSLLFGNINLLKNQQPFITIPSERIITSYDTTIKTLIESNTHTSYEITEITLDDPFELEIL